ncbi:hypothetical protein ACR6HW_03680 [Fusibacter sp. JL298sf-3]
MKKIVTVLISLMMLWFVVGCSTQTEETPPPDISTPPDSGSEIEPGGSMPGGETHPGGGSESIPGGEIPPGDGSESTPGSETPPGDDSEKKLAVKPLREMTLKVPLEVTRRQKVANREAIYLD